MNRNYKIYSLSEPDSSIVRYVGLTGKSIERRLKNHLKEKNNNHRCCWLKSLQLNGLLPKVDLIEDGLTLEQAKTKEIDYIKLFKSVGANLVNGTLGGDGLFGYKHSDESKEKNRQKHIGKRATDATKRLMGLNHKSKNPNVIPPNQSGNKNSMFGKTHTKEARDSVRKARTCNKINESDVLQIRTLYSEGIHSYENLGIIYGVKRGVVERIIKRKTWRNI